MTATTAPAVPAHTVLMVDDEPSVLSALRRLFRPQGYRILQATSGEDALVVMSTEKVDLVISDMRMPEMDGAQLLERVRQRHPTTSRILLTGYADIKATIAAINGGEIHRYITKPWDDQDLLVVVREALSRRDLEEQNRELVRLTQDQNRELVQLNQTLENRVQARVAEIEQVANMLDAAYDELNQTFTVAVTIFAGMLEMRQDGIAGHSRRVADLSRRVAVELKLDANTENEVYLAALLHDIGKLGFPDSMLGKPTSLYSPDELTRYRRHPEDGETALMPLAKLHGVAHIIRQHHERVDGYGFPDGLIGHQIHAGALIIAAVSDFDGLVHGGAAPQKYAPEEALSLMQALAGKHYDKAVLTALAVAVREQAPPPASEFTVAPCDLKPGMKLSRDLLSPKGTLLLPKGLVFNPKVILQVQKFAASAAIELELHIVKDRLAPPKSVPPPAPPAPVPVTSPGEAHAR
ncbi:HD domain-containing phosphohydrolase [Ideonella sp.]|uniref:HD domain-containing phosphohydrolase n=1 Tax=Ideonella sp. TaxID=1929293 RepID=UPI003BB4F159